MIFMSLEQPNWYNTQDRLLYDELFYHDVGRPLTEDEERFCNTMYHYEEYASGLDGGFENDDVDEETEADYDD